MFKLTERMWCLTIILVLALVNNLYKLLCAFFFCERIYSSKNDIKHFIRFYHCKKIHSTHDGILAVFFHCCCLSFSIHHANAMCISQQHVVTIRRFISSRLYIKSILQFCTLSMTSSSQWSEYTMHILNAIQRKTK